MVQMETVLEADHVGVQGLTAGQTEAGQVDSITYQIMQGTALASARTEQWAAVRDLRELSGQQKQTHRYGGEVKHGDV